RGGAAQTINVFSSEAAVQQAIPAGRTTSLSRERRHRQRSLHIGEQCSRRPLFAAFPRSDGCPIHASATREFAKRPAETRTPEAQGLSERMRPRTPVIAEESNDRGKVLQGGHCLTH